ncbi:MAG: hypothetical protein A2V65_01455 [Deltaproteobacteria bacterium RBG_13_49_15]|nr:MAG: hypothetical protein A2V65_01455 [Deltaproteobacteria bacterium RBG_13_49_15]
MRMDFEPFFKRYEELLAKADAAFDRVKTEYPEHVKCTIGCADCCHAVFDLSLVEALYINHHFQIRFQGAEKARVLEKANHADRKAHKLKKKAYQELRQGKKEVDILVEMAGERIRCPLLNSQDACDLYERRPITCRLYGLPTLIGGISHTCGRSGFVEKTAYPTVKVDVIQKTLYDISNEIVATIRSRYVKMGDMLVPLSMALLTDYDDEYLGIKTEKRKKGD